MATKHYLGIAEFSGTSWAISFPSFPGTTSAADDFAELMINARDALATVVEVMQEDGDRLPPSVEEGQGGAGTDLSDYTNPRTVIFPVEVQGETLRLSITMDGGLVAQLDRLSRDQGSSRSALLARGARMILAAERAA